MRGCPPDDITDPREQTLWRDATSLYADFLRPQDNLPAGTKRQFLDVVTRFVREVHDSWLAEADAGDDPL